MLLEVLRTSNPFLPSIPGCYAALFSQINGTAGKAFGDCVLQYEYSVTTHVYISYAKIANG